MEERMGLPIITYGNDVLRRVSRLVPDVANLGETVENLIDEMFVTVDAVKGAGLAAVQVGSLLRIFVTRVKGDIRRVFINPEIVETSVEEVTIEEGCLSIPGVEADVTRPVSVRVQAWDRKGKPFVLSAEGLLARAIQHEMDHLNGVLYVDRIEPKRAKRVLKLFTQRVAV
jgi:peptide deformylase